MKKLSIIMILSLIIVLIQFNSIVFADGENWLTDWIYRQSHTINSAVGSGINYQILITIDFSSGSSSGDTIYVDSKCKTNFGDIRFTDNDGDTELNYWLESKVDSDYADFWVEIADDLTSNILFYVYYGNTEATYTDTYTDLEHGENTFILFDNFEDSSYDTDKWNTQSGSPVEADGYLRVDGDDILSQSILPTVSHRQKLRSRIGDNTVYGFQVCFMKNIADNEYCGYYWNPLYQLVLRDFDGSPTDTFIDDPVNNQWYNYEYAWKSSVHTYFYVDSIQKAYHTTNIPDTQNYYTRFLSYGDTSVLDIDWVFLSKYVSPEPSHGAWSAEEGGEEKIYITWQLNEGGKFYMNYTELTNSSEIEYNNSTLFILLGSTINSSYIWLNFTWIENSSIINLYNLTLYGNNTVWCYFSLSGVGGIDESYFVLGFVISGCAVLFMVIVVKGDKKKKEK